MTSLFRTRRAGDNSHGWRQSRPNYFYELRLIAMIFAWNGAFWSLNLTAINAAPLTAFRILSILRACLQA